MPKACKRDAGIDLKEVIPLTGIRLFQRGMDLRGVWDGGGLIMTGMVTNTDGARPQTKAPPTRPPWQWPPLADHRVSQGCHAVLVSRHRSDVVGCAQPSERSARRIACPYRAVLASDATPRCASMASADRQMIG